jgi:hypothetical protein
MRPSHSLERCRLQDQGRGRTGRHPHLAPVCQVVIMTAVLDGGLAGPGSDLPEVPILGFGSAALDARVPPRVLPGPSRGAWRRRPSAGRRHRTSGGPGPQTQPASPGAAPTPAVPHRRGATFASGNRCMGNRSARSATSRTSFHPAIGEPLHAQRMRQMYLGAGAPQDVDRPRSRPCSSRARWSG